jgi:3-hydroxybutyryl-CoA dehydratase
VKTDKPMGISACDLNIGDRASFTKTISESDVYTYAGITGDLNPAHVNEEYARATQFGGRVAHGMLSVGLISAVLGTKLPGPGTIYLGQDVAFKKPVRIGDTITAEVEVVNKIDKTKYTLVELKTICTNQTGEVVIEGIAKVIPPQ